jgi:rare lipoprotein A
MRAPALALLALLLAACAGPQTRPSAPTEPPPRRPPSQGEPVGEQGGGLYAPHIRDGGPEVPPDVSGLPEPVPRAEPRARYGNHSPYVVLGRRYHVMNSAEGYVERGVASWYGTKFHGRPTSSFEPYDMYQFTAAHKTLPLPTYARVTNLENGRSITVRINDRGPFHADRLIDLSYAAAVKLGIHIRGTGPVEVRAIVPPGMHSTTAPGPAPTVPQGVPAVPAVTPILVEAGDVLLQVGSFAERANADDVERRLRAAGIGPVRVQRAEVGGARVHRVQVGPVDVDHQADMVERVQRLGLGTPRPVRP